MLTALTIRNLAIIEQVSLDLETGFSVLTGETGAGKSILIDALGLLLGGRADTQLVREGSDRAEVSGEFRLAADCAARTWLDQQALTDVEAPDQLLIRRVVFAEGRTRAFVNGQAVNAGPLRELGEQLIEIFGQSESQTLLRPDIQRQRLDAFADAPTALAAVAESAAAVHALDARIAELQQQAARDPSQLEFLRYQVRELELLDLRRETLDALEQDQRRLAHADQLISDGGRALDLLYAGEVAAHAQLGQALSRLSPLVALDPGFEEVVRLAEGAQAHLEEAADGLRRLLDRLDLDPAQLAEVERQLGVVHDLARKHRVKAEALGDHLAQLQRSLADSEGASAALEALARERTQAEKRYRDAADRLSAIRQQAATALAAEATALVRQLGMPNAQLEVSVTRLPDAPVRRTGQDDVRFDFTANPGQPPRPLARVASGGELSRISLALQVVITQDRSADTLIFDEVDAGISGGTAEIVGQQLRALGSHRQVLCVTHLAQVAAQARQHFGIRKQVEGNQTFTRVEPLAAKGRIDELARMQGGVDISDSARRHARELLARAGA